MDRKILTLCLTLMCQICLSQNLTFQEIVQTTALKGCGAGDLDLVDVDDDGDLDLFLGGRNNGFAGDENTTLYLNDGAGIFTEDTNIGFTIYRVVEAEFVDIDDDGDQDVILTGSVGSFPTTELYLNDGAGGFTLDSSFALPDITASDLSIGDIDGDGDLDIVFRGNIEAASQNFIAEVYLNDGSGNFTFDVSLNPDHLIGGNELVDIDGDGDLDIFCLDPEQGEATSVLYKNDGSGGFTTSLSNIGNYFDTYFALGDIDNDGDIDALVSGQDLDENRTPRIYHNDGTGVFNLEAIDSVFAPVTAGANALVDFDDDGDLDIFQSGAGASALFVTTIFENLGNENFQASDTLVGSYITELAIGDIDGDNFDDIIYGGRTVGVPENKTWVYRNSNEVTALDDLILEELKIEVYPNPTTGIFSIKGEHDNYSIQVIDATGSVHETYTQSSGMIEIDLSTLPAGIYLVKVLHTINGQVEMKKIIKM